MSSSTRISTPSTETCRLQITRPSHRARVHTPRREGGAILVIAVFFFFILGIGLYSIYNMGQLSKGKRQLTNAADAIAYSTATVAAEGLNYTAYTNRAMVANYHAVGHMTAMWSVMGMSDWYWRNNVLLMNAIASLTRFIPYIGAAISGVVQGIANFAERFWQPAVHRIRQATQLLANAGTATASITNYALFASQQVHLATTLVAMADMQNDLREANAPQAEYIPQTIAYQSVKSIYDFATMLGMHRPPGQYIADQKMTTGRRAKGRGNVKFNLVHHLMMEDFKKLSSSLTGRALLPNSIGLWMTDGCNMGHLGGILTGLEANGAQTIFPALQGVPGSQIMASTIEIFLNTIGSIVSPIMCMYERTGGSQIMQMQDGSYGWSSIDVMQVNLPFGIEAPLAGGVVLSKVGKNGRNNREDIPRDLELFAQMIARDEKKRNEYWGEATGTDDCLYITLPTGQLWEPRAGGGCFSFAAGAAKHYYQRGALNIAEDTTWRAMNGTEEARRLSSQASQAAVSALEPMLDQISQSVSSRSSIDSTISSLMDPATPSSPGVRGGIAAGMPATGSALDSPRGVSGSDAQLASTLANQLRQSGTMNPSALASTVQGLLSSPFQGAGQSSGGSMGGPDGFLRILLEILGLADLIDLLSGRISDGTETLFQKGRVGADLGLPFENLWLWEMRDADFGNYESGDLDASNMFISTTELQEAALKDLGPSFITALRQPIDTVPTAQSKGYAKGRVALPDFDGQNGAAYLQAIGKARIYYRAPVERWTMRGQWASHANLMLPYWNTRLEGLNYGEKLLFAGLSTF